MSLWTADCFQARAGDQEPNMLFRTQQRLESP